jgi:hypothetical protein
MIIEDFSDGSDFDLIEYDFPEIVNPFPTDLKDEPISIEGIDDIKFIKFNSEKPS